MNAAHTADQRSAYQEARCVSVSAKMHRRGVSFIADDSISSAEDFPVFEVVHDLWEEFAIMRGSGMDENSHRNQGYSTASVSLNPR